MTSAIVDEDEEADDEDDDDEEEVSRGVAMSWDRVWWRDSQWGGRRVWRVDDDADGLRRVGLNGVWWVVCVCWAWFAWLACFACFAWERVVTILLLDCCWSGYGFLDSRMWQVCCG